MSVAPSPELLSAALRGRALHEIPALPGRTNHLRAGVLVPLRWEAERLVCILTQRTAHLREHAGEVVFPGGKPEPSDRDLVHTALREAQEELGICDARPLGPLSAMPLFTSDYRLVPTVAQLGPEPLQAEAGEVARIFELDVTALLQAPSLSGIPWPQFVGHPPSPIFELPGAVMYGATAHTFYELLQVIAEVMGTPMPPWELETWRWEFSVNRPTRHGVVV